MQEKMLYPLALPAPAEQSAPTRLYYLGLFFIHKKEIQGKTLYPRHHE
jgi:hypothetical protein